MKVSFKNNTLTVVTDLKKEVVESGFSNLRAVDGKGNQVFAVEANKDGYATLSTFSLTGNAYIDGNLAAVMVFPMDTTLADVQKKYGEALLAADQYIPQIATEAADKSAAIGKLFA